MRLITIGFDGLHRSGKGTQILLLHRWLKANNCQVVIRRGDGTRKGTGKELQDPFSEWWMKNYDFLHKIDELPSEHKIKRINIASQRLNREIQVAISRCFRASSSAIGVLILDRTFVSRLFVLRQYLETPILENALFVENERTRRMEKLLIPDITFILRARQDTLVSRCNRNAVSDSKHNFRLRNIQENYSLFEDILLSIANSDFGNECIVINAEGDPGAIAELIQSKVKPLLDTC